MTPSPIPKITAQYFEVPHLDGLSEFYGDLLGMEEFATEDNSKAFAYGADQCRLVFHHADVGPYQAQANDFYWKIGITIRNLDAAVSYLKDRGLALPAPYQFRDIGYLSKITDPNGFAIELLQQGFEGKAEPLSLEAHPHGHSRVPPQDHPLAIQATLAHITLRVTDLTTAQGYFENTLGMRLMSVQPVTEYGFCLYFYSWSNEPLPDPDLTSVDNREWLWALPYTLIELQHLEGPDATIHRPPSDQSGFTGFSYCLSPKETNRFVSLQDLKHLS